MSLGKLLLCMNGVIEAVPLRGVTIVTLEAMIPEALKVIRANDTTGKPVGMIEGVAKKESTLQDIFLQRKNKVMLHISEVKVLRTDSSGSKRENLCFECHNSEHLARECPNPFCYRSGVKGHRSYNCIKVNSWGRDCRRSGRTPDYMRDGHYKPYYERSPPHSGTHEYASRVSNYKGSGNRNN